MSTQTVSGPITYTPAQSLPTVGQSATPVKPRAGTMSKIEAIGVPVIIGVAVELLNLFFPGNKDVGIAITLIDELAPIWASPPAATSIEVFRVGSYEVGPIPLNPITGPA